MPLHQRTQNFTDRRSRTPGTVMVKGRRCQDGDVAVTCVINHHFWTIASSMTRWQNLRNFDYLAAREGLVLIMVLTQMISAKFWTASTLSPLDFSESRVCSVDEESWRYLEAFCQREPPVQFPFPPRVSLPSPSPPPWISVALFGTEKGLSPPCSPLISVLRVDQQIWMLSV